VTSGTGATVAVRLPLDPGPRLDPYALAGPTGIVFQSSDRVLVGLGGALTLPLPHGLEASADVARVTRALASVGCDDRFDPTTSGVLAFGALPFDRSEPAALVVPRIVYGAEASGQEWVTVVAHDRSDLPDGSAGLRSWLARRSAAGPNAACRLAARPSRAAWSAASFRSTIRSCSAPARPARRSRPAIRW